jgi:N-methylhydantoinase A
MPRIAHYLDRMQEFLVEEGMNQTFHVMQCSGGVVVADALKRTPILMLESGPAAGALAGGYIGRSCGLDRVIAFDMGGTTAKVSIVEHGEPHLVEQFEIAHEAALRPGSGLPVTVPTVDLIEIGTGGGSIAHLDAGVLAVGPESSSASPGPACYGNGGTRPTVTDANVVLGYLDPDYFLGGELQLDVEAARAAIKAEIAEPLSLSVEEAAFVVHTVASTSMANAMRVMTIQRGLDPRDFATVAFGGAGPSHVAGMAQELGIDTVIVPANAGVASALGLLVARVKFEFARTLITRFEPGAVETINEVFAELETRGRDSLESSEAGEDAALVRQARMRYVGQGYEITVEIPAGTIGTDDLDLIRASFLETYSQLYGYSDEDGALEFVDWRLTALGPASDTVLSNDGRADDGDRPQRSTRQAYFPSLGGYVDVDVWNRYRLAPGDQIAGPGVVQERESTTLIPPGVTGVVDDGRNLVLSIPRRDTHDGR